MPGVITLSAHAAAPEQAREIWDFVSHMNSCIR